MNLAYLLTLALAVFAVLASAGQGSALTLRLWFVIAGSLLALTVLRTGHIAIWVDVLLRGELTRLGLYPHRRPVQIAAIAMVIFLAGLALRWMFPGQLRLSSQSAAALGALTALVAFAAVRASSLHWTDEIIEGQIGPTSVGQIYQLLCLVVIACSAILRFAVRRDRGRDGGVGVY